MARFHFHLHNQFDVFDDVGLELPDVAAAISEALHSARELASRDVKEGTLNLLHRIDVDDDQGHHVATMTFADAIVIQS